LADIDCVHWKGNRRRRMRTANRVGIRIRFASKIL